MKLYITLEINRIDSESAKGEEFDQELQDAIEGIDINGWEVQKVNIERVKQEDKTPAQGIGECIKVLAEVITIENIETKHQLDEPSNMNEKYTWREMLLFWATELMKKPKK